MSIFLTRKDFYFGLKNGIKCFPLRYEQGCYGDCFDCHSKWKEQPERLNKLPLNLKVKD